MALDGSLEIALHGNQGIALAIGGALAPTDATALIALELLLDFLGNVEPLSAGEGRLYQKKGSFLGTARQAAEKRSNFRRSRSLI